MRTYDGSVIAPLFPVGSIVEQEGLGDLPFIVVGAENGIVPRYELEGIDGSKFSNFPECMPVKARPAKESKWGLNSTGQKPSKGVKDWIRWRIRSPSRNVKPC